MDRLFSMDNPVWRAIGRLVDLVWINILTLVCALPVFTAGASFTAMYDVLLRMAEDRQGALTGRFFRAFRKNFLPATKLWLCALAVLAVYGYNLWLVHAGALDGLGALKKVSLGVILLILFLLIVMMHYCFGLTARYENSMGRTVKNAALLTIAFFPKSFCMGVLTFFPLALTLLSDYFFWLWFLYGLAYPGWLIARLMATVFARMEERDGE